MGDMIELDANGRTVPGYLAKPPSGRGPGLIVIQKPIREKELAAADQQALGESQGLPA